MRVGYRGSFNIRHNPRSFGIYDSQSARPCSVGSSFCGFRVSAQEHRLPNQYKHSRTSSYNSDDGCEEVSTIKRFSGHTHDRWTMRFSFHDYERVGRISSKPVVAAVAVESTDTPPLKSRATLSGISVWVWFAASIQCRLCLSSTTSTPRREVQARTAMNRLSIVPTSSYFTLVRRVGTANRLRN